MIMLSRRQAAATHVCTGWFALNQPINTSRVDKHFLCVIVAVSAHPAVVRWRVCISRKHWAGLPADVDGKPAMNFVVFCGLFAVCFLDPSRLQR